ncbi:MAG: hypothetical protein ACPG8U_02595, partial [Candidatus Thalassarchaeaceae archaeon]
MTSVLDQLQEIRNKSGNPQTIGLSDSLISKFSDIDPLLRLAVDEAISSLLKEGECICNQTGATKHS